jgi:hypothetical protein
MSVTDIADVAVDALADATAAVALGELDALGTASATCEGAGLTAEPHAAPRTTAAPKKSAARTLLRIR